MKVTSKFFALWVIGLTCSISLADTVLPAGNAPQPVEVSHFPSRLHAFVWRNWPLVEAERLAQVLETTADDVKSIAESMGLSGQQAIPDQDRIYITLIRRNWHLLPYDQLLTLLDMTPERLAHSLKEDDFLFIKLGSHKPQCDRLVYHVPTEQEKFRCDEIKSLIQEYVVENTEGQAEPRLHFVQELNREEQQDTEQISAGAKRFSPRFIYSYFALYGDPLMDPDLESYSEGLLQKLSKLGIDGIWIHTVLRQLSPSDIFTEFGEDHQTRLASLNKLVERAQKYGLGVYLYMNEPRTMPQDFFKHREELRGVQYGDSYALCTSKPEVRRWITDSLAYVFTQTPDLAGVFTITASENHTHCASHGRSSQCSRCKNRSVSEIVAELNAAIEAGVDRGNPEAKVIVWDWGWNDSWAEDAIRTLPESTWFMSVSEWSKPINRGGVESTVGEYSLSAVGPGPRAVRHWAIAKEQGLKTIAKMQINNTWELSSVPFLPVYDLIAQHCANLLEQEVDGLMLSWTLGGYPSPNLELVNLFDTSPPPSKEEALQTLAEKYFGKEGAPDARAAWTAFSTGFQEYPFHVGVIYSNPVQMGPANLLYPLPTGYAATMVGIPYDDLDGWRGPYSPDIFARQFERIVEGWDRGISYLETAIEKAPLERKEPALDQLRFARAARLHFSSVSNQARFTYLRNLVLTNSYPDNEYEEYLDEMRNILEREREISLEHFALTREDSRIGFEASNHYYYVPHDLLEKMINCQDILNRIAALYPMKE